MDHHSSYSAPRSDRMSGSPGSRQGKSAKRNTYNTQSWKDNRILRNLVFYVLPFVVVNLILFTLITASPKIELTIGETTDYKTVDISFRVRSILPIREMTVTLESQPVEVERSDGAYRATLDSNGTLEIYAEGWNGMSVRDNEHIAVLDDAAPVIDQEDYVLEDGHLEFLVSDSQSGVDFSSIYGTEADGQNVRPASYSEDTGRVVFEMEGSDVTVFVSDFAGNISQAAFSIHTNGIDTENRELDFSEDEEDEEEDSSSSSTRETAARKLRRQDPPQPRKLRRQGPPQLQKLQKQEKPPQQRRHGQEKLPPRRRRRPVRPRPQRQPLPLRSPLPPVPRPLLRSLPPRRPRLRADLTMKSPLYRWVKFKAISRADVPNCVHRLYFYIFILS